MRLISKKIWITVLCLLIPYLFVLVICVKKTDYEAILPGGLTEVGQVIEVDTDNKEKGSFNTVFVYTYPHTTVFQKFILDIDEKSEAVSYDAYLHLTDEEIAYMGKISHDNSVTSSILMAYSLAKNNGHNVKYNYKFSGMRIYYRYENQEIRVNDLIYKVNDIDYNDVENYYENLRNLKYGDKLTMLRNNTEFEVIIDEKYIGQNTEGYTYFKFSIYDTYYLNYDEFLPKITVNPSTSGGPSGGLLQTLAIYNQITEFDYTYGLKIAGTGTMNGAGDVGAIGGIKEKIYTGYYNNVDIFFCPEANKEGAIIAYDSLPNKRRMKLVFVKTLGEAIRYLEEYDD